MIAAVPAVTERRVRFHRLIASQAVTGEAVAIGHYARMIGLARTTDERLALLRDAWRERAHMLSMRRVAEAVGTEAVEPDSDPYWARVRVAFDERAQAGDLVALYVIQDIVLESYAVVLYEALLPALEGELAERVRRIAVEEREHLGHGVEELARAWRTDPEATQARVDFANERVGRVLASWIRVEDCAPVCGVCGKIGGACAKDELRAAGVDVESFHPAFAEVYGTALRAAGLPLAAVARWLARLLG